MRLIDADRLLEEYPGCIGLAQKVSKQPTVEAWIPNVIPIEESESTYEEGEGDLCFKAEKYNDFDGFYLGVKGDGWDRYGSPLVPEWCNYCIPLPWKLINDAVNKMIDQWKGCEENV